MRRGYTIMLFFLLTAGCAGARQGWVPSEGVFRSEEYGVSLDIPAGWSQLGSGSYLVLTRDGIPLQNICLTVYKVGKPLKYAKEKIERGMLSQEVAEILIDDIASVENVASVEVLQNVPARFGDMDGFKVLCRIRMKGGLNKKCVFLGVLKGDRVYELAYIAAARHYFDRDLDTFERVARSFRFLPST